MDAAAAPAHSIQAEFGVRRISLADIDDLVDLCAEHADFERVTYDRRGKAQLLTAALIAQKPKLHAWVAESLGRITGYATATSDFATWTGRAYLHMDCLFVRAGERGNGVGVALLDALRHFAQEQGYAEIQWQTPDWNTDAVRFYRREGAHEQIKRRFTLTVDQEA
jgi:GNAT superfamily N-acetyltransferase